MNWAVESGRPGPMGAHHDGDGVRFTVFSAHATSIEVCVFDSAGAQHLASFALPGRSGDLFHGFLRGAGPGLVYGLRAHGPWDLAAGHRFEPGRLLLDPAAREIVDRSNAAADFKARVIADRYDWQGDQPPRHAVDDTILYELHVAGFTRLHPLVPASVRGSYRGLAHPQAIDHLKSLGVTAVSLLPVQQHLDERRLVERGRGWGVGAEIAERAGGVDAVQGVGGQFQGSEQVVFRAAVHAGNLACRRRPVRVPRALGLPMAQAGLQFP